VSLIFRASIEDLKNHMSSSLKWRNWKSLASEEWEQSVSWPLKVWSKLHCKSECSCFSNSRKIRLEWKILASPWLPSLFRLCSPLLTASLNVFSFTWKHKLVRLVLSTTALFASTAASVGCPITITSSRRPSRCTRKAKTKNRIAKRRSARLSWTSEIFRAACSVLTCRLNSNSQMPLSLHFRRRSLPSHRSPMRRICLSLDLATLLMMLPWRTWRLCLESAKERSLSTWRVQIFMKCSSIQDITTCLSALMLNNCLQQTTTICSIFTSQDFTRFFHSFWHITIRIWRRWQMTPDMVCAHLLS